MTDKSNFEIGSINNTKKNNIPPNIQIIYFTSLITNNKITVPFLPPPPLPPPPKDSGR